MNLSFKNPINNRKPKKQLQSDVTSELLASPQSNNHHPVSAKNLLLGALVVSASTFAHAVEPQKPANKFPTFDASVLGNLNAGQTKATVAHQLGIPRQSYDASSWYYQVNLRKPDTQTFAECVIKFDFDKINTVTAITFNSQACRQLAASSATKAPEKPDPLVVFNNLPIERVSPVYTSEKEGQYEINADLLFDFDSAIVKPNLVPKVQELAQVIQAKYKQIDRLQVTGYTDRIGSYAYNNQLGMRRANAVGFIFINEGFGDKVTVASMGETMANQTLCKKEKGQKLRQCLAKDRKVVINVSGTLKDDVKTPITPTVQQKAPIAMPAGNIQR